MPEKPRRAPRVDGGRAKDAGMERHPVGETPEAHSEACASSARRLWLRLGEPALSSALGSSWVATIAVAVVSCRTGGAAHDAEAAAFTCAYGKHVAPRRPVPSAGHHTQLVPGGDGGPAQAHQQAATLLQCLPPLAYLAPAPGAPLYPSFHHQLLRA